MGKFNFCLRSVNELLIYLLPIALIAGIFFADLFISASAAIFIYLSLYNRDYFYFYNKFFVFFILWSFYILITSLLSSNILLSLESTLFYFRFGFFSLSVWFAINNNNKFIKNFTIILSLTFFVILIDGFYQFFVGKNILGYEYETMRLSGFFKDEYIFGSYLSRILPILFGLLIFQFPKSNFALTFSLLILVAADIIIYLSGERLAFFNLIFGSILIILLIQKGKFLRLITLFFSIIIIFIITLNFEPIQYRMIQKTIDQIIIKEEKTQNVLEDNNLASRLFLIITNKVNIFSPQHQLHYQVSLSIFDDHKIFGAGPKMFRELCKEDKYIIKKGNIILPSCSTHPHNIYIQALAETGLIGFTFLISIFLIISFYLAKHFINVYFYKNYYLSDLTICLLIALLINLFPFAPSGNFYNNWISIIYFLPLGFLLNIIYKEGKK